MNNDLISRSALLDSFDVRWVTEYDEAGFSMDYKAVPVEAIEKAPAVDAEPVRHSGCALCDIKETGHGIIVYPDIRWITAINKQDGNFYMVFGHEGETAKMQIAYCPVCGKRLDAEDE